MIDLIGPEETSEYHAASQLRDLIAAAWPDVEEVTNTNDRIHIVAAAKCYGQSVVDIDLVVYVNLMKPRLVTGSPGAKQPIYIRSLCMTIEVKGHERDSVQFDGNQVLVRYGYKRSSATEQAHRQQNSLRNFLEAHGYEPPFVTDMVWLPNVPKEELPKVQHNIIGANTTWIDIMQQIVSLNRPKPYQPSGFDWKEIDAFHRCKPDKIRATIDLLTRRLEPTALDRKKIETLSSRRILKDNDAAYIKKLGSQLLIFRGRGGTGKTVHLLRFARELYVERDARVLILTYNKALVADLKRLLAIMGIGDMYGQRAIEVRTVHSFLYRLRQSLSRENKPPMQFIERYPSYRRDILAQLRKSRRKGEDPCHDLARVAPDTFAWDFVFIDEAQDWPDEERQILFLLYDYRRFVIADGVDQFVRKEKPTNWRHAVDAEHLQHVSLRKSLRLKAGLCTFAMAFAQALGLEGWRLEKDESIYGGRIIVVEGNYSEDRSLHDELVGLTRAAGNQPIDMLFCVPPSLVKRKEKEQAPSKRAKSFPRAASATRWAKDQDQPHSIVASRFHQWGYDVWDAVSEETRGSYPTRLDQLRIVQYDSCRGLEGWTCVNLRLDELYDYKLHEYRPPPQATFIEDEQAAHLFAAHWLMIPLTRAIDTLVIQINSVDHPVGQALQAACQECADLVDWRKISPKSEADLVVSG